MDAKPALPFHTKVRIRSKRPVTQEIDGQIGYVGGITEQRDENGHFEYGIFVYELKRVWCCKEYELESTGELDYDSVKRAEEQATRLAQKRLRRVEPKR